MAADSEAIWMEFSQRLRRFIGSKIDRPEDADDILQDVFQKIHSKADTLSDDSRVEPWIYRITRNTITDFYRQRALERAPLEAASHVAADEPRDEAESLLSCLPPIVDQLPDKYREALQLTEFEGLTQQELADRLGLSLSGAKSRVQRARVMMRDVLLACCHFELDRLGNVMDHYPIQKTCQYCCPEDAH